MIYKIGDFLIRSKDITIINDNECYQRVTVRMHHKGVVQRDKVLGSKIKTKRQYLVKSGQFIMSRIDARHGAFGIIPDDLDGAIITGDFLAFDIDTNKVNLEYFTDLTKSTQFIQFCIDSSTGTTNRKRLKEELFLAFEIEVPNKEKQDKIINKINTFKVAYVNLETELKQKEILVGQLKDSILRDAIQGKLVQQDENDEPAIVLLERIKEAKEQLIKEKKIKKEKPLPQITDEEKPFDPPNGWEWVRLGDIIYSTDAGKSPKCIDESVEGDKWGVIKTTAIQKNDFIETQNKVLPQNFAISDSYVIKKGDVLITRAGPKNRVGIVCYVDEITKNLILSDKTIRFSLPDNLIFNRYISLALNSPLIRPFIESKMTGMAESQVNISQNNMRLFCIPLPPLVEQVRISEKINQLMSLCDELEANIEQSKIESETLMKAVLQEAFMVKEEVLN
ncbi:restriction endonuclease subunit S [Bacillus toyonensis]|uniref:restriction endonuclease subunit S n=1 Tax=Bacillus toyonensis TaxID=155322 RepID=UPI0018D09238|nr:restriction endonuclease subunit S [Bacillus toyonensis]MBH0358173.1 hypothetical protein [Bacillus toyonensis biovar Thuringiensis]